MFGVREMPEQRRHSNRLRADPPRQLGHILAHVDGLGGQEITKGLVGLRHD